MKLLGITESESLFVGAAVPPTLSTQLNAGNAGARIYDLKELKVEDDRKLVNNDAFII